MKAKALVPALALAAALLASPSAEADSRRRSERGGRPPAHRYEGDRGNSGSRGYGYRPGYGYRNNRSSRGYRPGRSYYGYGYRPYSRGPRYYAPPPAYYGYGYGGYGYGGYDDYGYYPPPPPPRYDRPRGGVGIWFGF